MDTTRMHAVRFVPAEVSRHFILFDADVPLTARIEFMCLLALRFPQQEASCSVELRTVEDPAHPANGQLGLFARAAIPPNTVFLPYTGVVRICKGMTSSRTYAMGFGPSSSDFVVDAEFAGGLARFANDPRNTGHSANTIAVSRTTQLGEPFTALMSKRAIAKGEEILMDYGKAFHLDPRPWVLNGNLVTRVRSGGFLPSNIVDGEILRECTTCGYLQSAATPAPRCASCGCPNAPQHSRAIIYKSSGGSGEQQEAANKDNTQLCVEQMWPGGIAYLAWQIWDSVIPLLSIAAECKPQASVTIYDIGERWQLFSARKFAAGEQVCVVGGIASLHSETTAEAHTASTERHDTTRLLTLNLAGFIGCEAQLTLRVTNEVQFARIVDDEKLFNTAPAIARDPLGFPIVKLLATRTIEAFEEIAVLRSDVLPPS